MVIELKGMSTETRNERTMELDAMPMGEFLAVMNDEDARVAPAIRETLPQIEKAVEKAAGSFRKGGRLIYTGAGTSGRLGIIDATECVPTFGVPNTMVVGIIAGGDGAVFRSVEGAEDDAVLGASDLKEINVNERDTVVGIAASGRTPYVIGALEYAKKMGASTVSVACNKDTAISKIADIAIEVVPGPEVLTGSTRLKAGTAQKLVLNMISTGAMVAIGKVYKNLMVDVMASNAKLKVRAENIVMEATGAAREAAKKALAEAGESCKTAIVMLLLSCSSSEAAAKLKSADGHVRKAI